MTTSTHIRKSTFTKKIESSIKKFKWQTIYLLVFCLSFSHFNENCHAQGIYLNCVTNPANNAQSNLLPCLDQITVQINHGTSMDSVYFDFPLFFMYVGPLPQNAISYIIPEPEQGENVLLQRIAFGVANQSVMGAINFQLRYMNCTPAAFNLYCSGRLIGGNIIHALLTQPMTPSGGSAVNSPILFPAAANQSLPIAFSAFQPGNAAGNVDDIISRICTVSVNHALIDTFRIRINQETDASQVSLQAYRIGGTDTILLANVASGLQFIDIDLSNPEFNNIITEDGQNRSFGIKQRVSLNCGAPISSGFSALMVCNCDSVTSITMQSGNASANVSILNSNLNLNALPMLDTLACMDMLRINIQATANAGNFILDTLQLPYNSAQFSFSNLNVRACNDTACSPWLQANSSWLTMQNNFLVLQPSFFANQALHDTFADYIAPPSQSGNNSQLILLANNKLEFIASFVPICAVDTGCAASPISFTLANNLTVRLKTRKQNCNANFNAQSVLSPLASTIPHTQLGGGSDEEDYDTGNPNPISFQYSFSINNTNPFNINLSGQQALGCGDSLTYFAFFEAINPAFANINISAAFLNNQQVNIINTNDGFMIQLPKNMINFQISNALKFNFTMTGCPFEATFGELNFRLSIKVTCNTCLSNCTQTLVCADGILIIHCPGLCGNDFLTETKSAQTRRITLGWENSTSFLSEAPLMPSYYESLNLDPIDKRNELRKVYPYDLFKLIVNGNVYPIGNSPNGSIVNLGVEIAYSQTIGSNIFEMLDYRLALIDTTSADSTWLILQVNPLDSGQVAGISQSFYKRRFFSDSLPDSTITQNYKLYFEATMRMLEPVMPNNISDLNIDFRTQFINTNIGNYQVTSCDPYGTKLRLLIPKFSQITEIHPSASDTVAVGEFKISFPNTGACNVKQSTLFTLSGGIGPFSNDFPFEYRPMLSWPAQGTLNNGQAVNGSIPPNHGFNLNLGTGQFSNNVLSNLLYPMEKGDTLFLTPDTLPIFSQAIGFTLKKDCPAAEFTDTISLNTRRMAYLHSGHQLNSSLDSIQWVQNPIVQQAPADNALCATWLKFFKGNQELTASSIIVGDEYTFEAKFQAAAIGSFQWVLFSFDNCNQAQPASIAIHGTLPNGIMSDMNGDNLLLYSNGLLSQLTSVSLKYFKRSCSDCTLKINWGSLCSMPPSNQINADTLLQSCNTPCHKNILFKTNINPSLTKYSSEIQYVNEEDFCGLAYTVMIRNTGNQPTLLIDSIALTMPTGFLYENATAAWASSA